MAEAPLTKLARVLGGVALGYGPFGHQVIGQLITLNAKEIEVAAATVLITAASGQKDATAYAAIRILAPAVAVHLLTRREEQRLEQFWERLEEKEQRLATKEAELAERAGARATLGPGAGTRARRGAR